MIKEVRLNQLPAVTSHPICISLLVKFSSTLMAMLSILKTVSHQWHRYLSPLLCAYREVPQPPVLVYSDF